MNRVLGKVAIVTGSGSGLGRAEAMMFAREGAKVAVTDINDKNGMETVALIRQEGGEAEYWHLNVSVEKECADVLAKVVEKFGKPQMLYAAGDDGGLQSARIANLACTAHGIHESSALNNKAPIQDTRAFIDIAEAEAGKIQARHIVLICSHSAFNRLLHQSPAFGNSYTLCASDWEKFLDNYVKIWSPFDLDCEHPDEARKMADRIFNIPCSTDESMLIERTLAAYCAI